MNAKKKLIALNCLNLVSGILSVVFSFGFVGTMFTRLGWMIYMFKDHPEYIVGYVAGGLIWLGAFYLLYAWSTKKIDALNRIKMHDKNE
jgi:putative Mn2+ efflux pump MntP